MDTAIDAFGGAPAVAPRGTQTFRNREARARAALVSLCCALTIVLAASGARAEESIIKRPGDHPSYSLEIEPHALAAFLHTRAGDGYGLGARFTVPLVKNGFVSTINDNVGIGFGLDWAHYSGCYYYYVDGPFGYDCPTFNAFVVPVVMQWNFFLSTHWSVFAEPGLAIEYGAWADCPANGVYYDARGNPHPYACGPAPSHVTVDPFVFFFGGRFHFSESTALTLRVGWPYFSVGVSFLP